MSRVAELLNELELQLQTLKQLLLINPLMADKCQYQQLSYAAHDNNEFVPPSITDHLTGAQALFAAAKSFHQIFRSVDQEPLSVFRACGIIPTTGEVFKLVMAINHLKDEIKAEMIALPRRQRDKVKNQYHAGLILKQVYRHIPMFSESASVVSASWVMSGTSTSLIGKHQLIELLANIKAGRMTAGQSHQFIQQNVDLIQQYPENHSFKVLRATRPHTRYRVKDQNGKWHDLQAHLPLLVAEGNPVEYKPLADPAESSPLKLDKSNAIIPWAGVVE